MKKYNKRLLLFQSLVVSLRGFPLGFDSAVKGIRVDVNKNQPVSMEKNL